MLPTFRKKPKEQNPNPQNSKPEEINALNLLKQNYREEFDTFQEYQYQSNNYLKTATLMVQMAFILVVMLNIYVNFESAQVRKQITETAQIILKDKPTEEKLVEITDKIAQYKEIKNQIEPLYPKLESINEKTIPEVTIESFEITRNKAKLSTKAGNAISYAYLIDSYYSSPEIKKITIVSANKNRVTGEFSVELELQL